MVFVLIRHDQYGLISLGCKWREVLRDINIFNKFPWCALIRFITVDLEWIIFFWEETRELIFPNGILYLFGEIESDKLIKTFSSVSARQE